MSIGEITALLLTGPVYWYNVIWIRQSFAVRSHLNAASKDTIGNAAFFDIALQLAEGDYKRNERITAALGIICPIAALLLGGRDSVICQISVLAMVPMALFAHAQGVAACNLYNQVKPKFEKHYESEGRTLPTAI